MSDESEVRCHCGNLMLPVGHGFYTCDDCKYASYFGKHTGKTYSVKAGEDPKGIAGSLKDPMHLIPTIAMRAEARVLALGEKKYGRYNWRETPDGVRATVYVGAILRHLTQYMDGEDKDAESGESHLAHIRAGCAILLDSERMGKLVDDRPVTWER